MSPSLLRVSLLIYAGLFVLFIVASTKPAVSVESMFRTKIDITINTGSLPATIKIVLNRDNWDGWRWVSVDGSDIYFTDSDGNPLYYFIESFDIVSEKAVIWVNATTNTVYMYYGGENPYTDYNNPDKVFYFYDDFDGMEKWNITRQDAGTAITVENSIVKFYRSSGGKAIVIQTKEPIRIDYPILVEARQYIVNSDHYYYHSVAVGDPDAGYWSCTGYVVYPYYESAVYTGSRAVPPRTGSASSTDGDVIDNPPTQKWFISRFYVDPTEYLKHKYNSGDWQTSTRYKGIGNRTVYIKFVFASPGSYTVEAWFDYIRVYRYVGYTYTIAESEYLGSGSYANGYITENIHAMLLPGVLNDVVYVDGSLSIRYTSVVDVYFYDGSSNVLDDGFTIDSYAGGVLTFTPPARPYYVFYRAPLYSGSGLYDADASPSSTVAGYIYVSSDNLVYARISNGEDGYYTSENGISSTSTVYHFLKIYGSEIVNTVENDRHEFTSIDQQGVGTSSVDYLKNPYGFDWVVLTHGEDADPDLNTPKAVVVYVRFSSLNIVNATITFEDGYSITVENPGEIVKYSVAGHPSHVEAVLSITYRPEQSSSTSPTGAGGVSGLDPKLSIDFIPLLTYMLVLIIPVARYIREYIPYYLVLLSYVFASFMNITVLYTVVIVVLFAVSYKYLPFNDELKMILSVVSVYVLSTAIVFNTFTTAVPPANPLDWGSWLTGIVSFTYLPHPFGAIFTVLFASLLAVGIIRLTLRVIRGA